MDVSIPLIFIVLFIVASFSLFLVYKYGIKEKSYEEALAEQRQQTNVLLGVKTKPKDKKSKKAAKKPKEKESKEKPPAFHENETDETGSIESNYADKHHVEFKEEPEEVPLKEVIQAPVKPKRIKKVRPILIKKEKSPVRPDLNAETPIANHFEENPPKDDFELMRSNSRDDIFKQEPLKEKPFKEKKSVTEVVPPTRNKKEKAAKLTTNIPPPPVNSPVEKEAKEVKEKLIEKEIVDAVVSLSPTNVDVIGNPGKEKKKKKSEFNMRQQLTAERDGLINSVRKAELSKTEIQLLIDLLLNKQLEAPAIIDEWSEGKSDPIQKLKKQLTEKEKALAEEQEALAGAQAKLREIRAEQQAEKGQLQQKIRTFEEVVQNKQLEIQAINNRMAQKIQQLQAELNNEIIKARKFMDDNTALQMQLQQIQESDNIIAKLRSDVEEFSAQNQQLRMELQQSVGEKEHQNQQFRLEMGDLENTLKQQNEVNRQLTETNQKLQMNLDMIGRQKDHWNIEKTNLNTTLQQQYQEKLKLEETLRQRNDELHTVTNEKVDCTKIINQLKSQMNGASEESKNYEVEILNLTNELSSLKNELSEFQENEKKYKMELETSSKNYSKIQKELEEQKAKNNELRTKNWKVMEALNAAESKTNTHSTRQTQNQSAIDLKKITQEIMAKEQDSQKQFIQRLFPEISGLKAVTSEDWQTEFGKLIKTYVSDLQTQQKQQSLSSSPQKNPEVSKLQDQLQHYKNIIDDTEGMLNNLQSHIEREEINWRNQLAAKEAEIEHLKEIDSKQLKTKVGSLEQQLLQEIKQKDVLTQKLEELKIQKSSSVSTADSTATIEKLSEEVNRLREQLRVEQNRNGETTVCIKAQNNCNNSLNGPTFIEVPTIRNANICSNMGCQFLYCDGNNCQGNL